MLGKFAAVLGPVLVGVMATLTGSSRVGISSLMVLFIGGAVLLWRVRVPERACSQSAGGAQVTSCAAARPPRHRCWSRS